MLGQVAVFRSKLGTSFPFATRIIDILQKSRQASKVTLFVLGLASRSLHRRWGFNAMSLMKPSLRVLWVGCQFFNCSGERVDLLRL
eukprot:SAG31_NODE_32484_length_355_cov_0.812500_2_plen_85_part_01